MHDALILAAGGSTRLGQPKQLLTRHGETLLARTVRLVLATRPSRTVVVLGAHADQMRAALDGLDVEVTVNPLWANGMASSLQCGATLLSGRAQPVLVTVVDQPALSVRHFDALLSQYDASSDVVTAYDDAAGVPVVLRPATLARATSLSGDEGFRRLWGSETPTRVRADDLGPDLDTPEDVQQAVLAGRLDPPGHPNPTGSTDPAGHPNPTGPTDPAGHPKPTGPTNPAGHPNSTGSMDPT